MIKKYQTIALQPVKKSADLFDHEMLDGRNRATSTEIIISDPTESEEHNI